MHDAAFDAWLALLSRFLRLSPKQRDEIRRELRAHLEDGVEAEVARGLSRDQAVLKVLEDLGDAAELAHRFRQPHPVRRWIMQGTLAAACLAIVAIGLSLLAPPAATNLQAQQLKAKPVHAAAADDPLDAALSKRLPEVNFQDAPLESVLRWIEDAAGVNIAVLWSALEEQGITRDHPMTVQLRDATVETALNIIFGELRGATDVRFEIVKNVLVIAPAERFHMVVRVYDVRDLLEQDGVTQPAGENDAVGAGAAEALVELVRDTVLPDSWEENGGAGRARVFKSKLVVRNYGWAHREIRDLLGQLRNSGTAD